ncbi:MAG: hypothetical protein PGN20_15265 [Agrobacterium cavarae]
MNSPFALPITISLQSKLSGGLQNPIATPLPSLGPAIASIASSAVAGTLIASITGLAAGETIDTVTPNDGRLALDSTRRNLLVGLSALSVGTIAATLKSNAGRTLAMAITVSQGAIALDAPIVVADKGSTIAAFGNARMVADWTSPSVNGKNNDTGATFQNGFDGTGREIISALPSNAGFVSWPDQNGSALTLAAVGGTPVMSAGGVVPRFATATQKGSDSQEVRLTDRGGTGIDLGGTSALAVTLPILLSSGDQFEVHVLWSPNRRMSSAQDVTSGAPNGNDPLNGLNSRQNLITLGNGTENRFQAYAGGGGSGPDNVSFTTGGATVAANGKKSAATYRFPKNTQYVTTHIFTATRYREFENGALTKDVALTSAQTTAILGGSMDNPDLAIASVFTGTSKALSTSFRCNCVVGGVIVTKNRSMGQIAAIQARMALIGQQHLAATLAEVKALFNVDLIDMRKANASTGRVTGERGNVNLAFNTGGTLQFGYTDPNTGLQGIRSPDNSNLNSYRSDEAFNLGRNGFTVLSFGMLESGTVDNNVQVTWSLSKGDPQVDTRSNAIWMLGYHHAVPAAGTKPSAAKDKTSVIERRKLADLITMFNYDGLMQTLLKYNYWTALIRRLTTEVINTSQTNNAALTLTAAVLENTDASSPIKFDAPLPQQTSDNLQYLYKVGQSQLMIHVHEPSTVHNYDSQSPSPSTFFTAKNRLYVSGGGIQPFGHMDGGVGAMPYAPVVHGDGDERLQSVPYQNQAKANRAYLAIADRPLSDEEVRKVQANWYKVREAA